MIKDTHYGSGMVLITLRSWALFYAFVDAFYLTPSQNVYEYPQRVSDTVKMTYDEILAFLDKHSDTVEYDLYMDNNKVSGIVVGSPA